MRLSSTFPFDSKGSLLTASQRAEEERPDGYDEAPDEGVRGSDDEEGEEEVDGVARKVGSIAV